jgi:hypothetical protein
MARVQRHQGFFVAQYSQSALVLAEREATVRDVGRFIEKHHAGATVTSVVAVKSDSPMLELLVPPRQPLLMLPGDAPAQGYDVSLTQQEIDTLVAALEFYFEQPTAPQVPRPIRDGDSRLLLFTKLHTAPGCSSAQR